MDSKVLCFFPHSSSSPLLPIRKTVEFQRVPRVPPSTETHHLLIFIPPKDNDSSKKCKNALLPLLVQDQECFIYQATSFCVVIFLLFYYFVWDTVYCERVC